ncbi:MAG: DUF1552 domain-containing protein [Myxococcales bacterium]|nr:DUF1552 domain-containing protein [Myxococcales bacterium]
MKALRIPRRALLRGMAGTAVSLPLLECMLPRAARAQQAPRRYCLTFGGFSLNVDGSPGAQALVPDRAGAGYDVKRMLDPIDDYPSSSGASLRDEITVVSGLSIPHAQRLGEPGARAPGDSFHFHTNPMLCGLPQQGELDATVTGPSSDQLVADAIGGDSLFSSLTYRAQARFYNTGGGTFDAPHHRDTMSFRMVSGSARAVTPETSPRAAYDSLFTLFTPTDPAQAAERARELAKRRSILDFVDRNINGLLPRLSSYDRLVAMYRRAPRNQACRLPTSLGYLRGRTEDKSQQAEDHPEQKVGPMRNGPGQPAPWFTYPNCEATRDGEQLDRHREEEAGQLDSPAPFAGGPRV